MLAIAGGVDGEPGAFGREVRRMRRWMNR